MSLPKNFFNIFASAEMLVKSVLKRQRHFLNVIENCIKLDLGKPSKKKKTEKSDIVQKGRVGWTPKSYFQKE